MRLHEALHAGWYRPQPVLRQWIPKVDGRQRPLGVTCVEDKVVQKALVMVLEAVYEVDFLGFSYGFRPGRGQHDALDAVYMALTTRKVGREEARTPIDSRANERRRTRRLLLIPS